MRSQGRSGQGWFANGIEGRHVLIGLIVFFGVMLAANSALVYYALDTFSGGERPDPYRSGLNYNETIAAAERQATLGWEAATAYDAEADRLTLRFVDSAKEPVTGLRLAATLTRPATNREDRTLDVTEIAQGVYAADVTLDPGNWVLTVESLEHEDGDPTYRMKRRLIVPHRP